MQLRLSRRAPKMKVLCAALVLGWSAGAATAGPSSSSVSISSFDYTTSAGSVTWSDPFQSFQTTALNAGGLLGADTDSFDDTAYSQAILFSQTSRALATMSTASPQTFFLTAQTTASVGASTNQPNKAESIGSQSGAFTLVDANNAPIAGRVTFNIGYMIDVLSPGGNPLTDYASALLSFNASDSDRPSVNTGASLMSFNQASGIASRTGTLTLFVDLTAGESGFYTLQGSALAFSTAAIPEPSEWALMSVGLFGVLAYARRKAKRSTA